MKKFFSILMFALLTVGGCNRYDHEALESDVRDLKNRVAALEMWAATVNSNVAALQDIVAALQNTDYITGVTTFASPAPGGYVISFLKSGNITISNGRDGTDGADGRNGADGWDGTNGKDGADGTNGTNGSDGVSPQISVKQDTDGVYYWTLDGAWIVAGGNKMRVTGEKGADGGNGQNGNVPLLRINSGTGIWEASYDGGGTWTSLGVAAAGEDGADGTDGITPQLRINSGTGIW
jgi:outer membrane murein-binding lipoprotein Lpp